MKINIISTLSYNITSSSLSLTLSQNISTLDNIGTTLTQLKSVTTLLQQCNKIVTKPKKFNLEKQDPPYAKKYIIVLCVHFWGQF